ncbi:MAG: matrixin family metalloprotease [Deltaproteobacteria bacterium]|nr:matrixin family metalloprotease [Deltaproteobacteria bacterium]
MRALVALALALAALVLTALPAPAEACVRTRTAPGGPCLYWGLRTVPIHVNQAGSDDLGDGSDFDAVERGVGQWTGAACSDFAFEYRGLTSHTDVGFRVADPDNQNLIVWREALCREVVPASDPCWSCLDTGGECCGSAYDCWEHPRGVIAVTTTTFSRITGSLVDADIELNGVDYWFTALDAPTCDDPLPPPRCLQDSDCLASERCFQDECLATGCVRTDIENTVTHEAGHIVGLDHSAVPLSTMYASAPQGEILKRSLEDDDLECFCDTYPIDAPTVTCFGREVTFTPVDQKKDTRGCRGCASGAGASGGLLAGLLLLALLALRRRGLPLALLLALSPAGARAHLLNVQPDLDAWVARGELVGLASAVEAPVPCGAGARPAIQEVVIEVLVDEERTRPLADTLLRKESVAVLLGDDHAPALPRGKLGAIVLLPAGEESACSSLPQWQVATPGPPSPVVERETDWMNYLGGVVGLPDAGAARRSALEALWLEALGKEDATLIAHATARLATLGELPAEVRRRLASIAADDRHDRAVRLQALQLAGAELDVPTARALLADPDLELAEASLGLLLEASAERQGALEDELTALRTGGRDTPRAVILEAASLAVLAGSGNPVHREPLAELLSHRLFKARRWAVLGLGALARKGDVVSSRMLAQRWREEPDARIRAVIEVELGGRPEAQGEGALAQSARSQEEKQEVRRRTSNLGLRMIFVLLGLLALTGMLVLPRIRPLKPPPSH